MPTTTELLIQAVSDATCGDACWEAREDVCRCSCDGKNHGVFFGTGKRPDRTSKIDSYVYRLAAVGEYASLYNEAQAIKAKSNYRWQEKNRGAPAHVKAASKSQAERWAELSAWNGLDDYDWSRNGPYLLWVRT